MPQQIVSLSAQQMQALAEASLPELIQRGLLEEALSLTAAFTLSTPRLISHVVGVCLSGGGAISVVDELGVRQDSWGVLREFLEVLDGKRTCPGAPHEMHPFDSRAGSYAFGSLHRAVGDAILSYPAADVPLPPWLKRKLRGPAGCRFNSGQPPIP